METKVCTNCGQEFPATNEFFSRNGKRLRSHCKTCHSAKNKKLYEATREVVLEKKKQYRDDNKEVIKERNKRYYSENKETHKARVKQYREAHKEAYAEQKKQYRRTKLQNGIGFRLLDNCRRRVNLAIKNNSKSASTIELIGCTVEELKAHLEAQFTEGMSWDNYGQWHIDHIKPCAMFDFTDEAQQRECFHFTNLQPLWAEDNLRKSDKFEQ